jgi:hypothetical protein
MLMEFFMNTTEKRFTVKKLVKGIGHDRAGFRCDLYLDRKKIAECEDEGMGPCAFNVLFISSETEVMARGVLDETKYAEYLNANINSEYDFKYKNVDYGLLFIKLVTDSVSRLQKQRFDKKIQRLCASRIVFGGDGAYQTLGWKNIKFLDALVEQGGLDLLQSAYDEALSMLEEGEKILNSNSHLEALGVCLRD